jgi:hypothetical protein
MTKEFTGTVHHKNESRTSEKQVALESVKESPVGEELYKSHNFS